MELKILISPQSLVEGVGDWDLLNVNAAVICVFVTGMAKSLAMGVMIAWVKMKILI